MTKKKLLGIAAAGAAAAVAVYFLKRSKGKLATDARKAGNKLRKHVTDVFHDAKMSAQEKMAGA